MIFFEKGNGMEYTEHKVYQLPKKSIPPILVNRKTFWKERNFSYSKQN